MRTFIAVQLPDALLAHVETVQRDVQASLDAMKVGRSIRWTAANNVHLTLRFLGETSPAQLRSLGEKLMAVVQQQPLPLYLRVDRLGCFPDYRQPRIVWLGLAGDLQSLMELQNRVEQAAVAEGFAAEPRSFQPHLTIGRARRDADRDALRQVGDIVRSVTHTVDVGRSADRLGFQVTEIVHMRSDLHPDGAVYTAIARFPLVLTS